MKKIEQIFGKPDFMIDYHFTEYPSAMYFEYSTSSIEVANGKCGEPITHSLCFIIGQKNKKVLEVREFIY